MVGAVGAVGRGSALSVRGLIRSLRSAPSRQKRLELRGSVGEQCDAFTAVVADVAVEGDENFGVLSWTLEVISRGARSRVSVK